MDREVLLKSKKSLEGMIECESREFGLFVSDPGAMSFMREMKVDISDVCRLETHKNMLRRVKLQLGEEVNTDFSVSNDQRFSLNDFIYKINSAKNLCDVFNSRNSLRLVYLDVLMDYTKAQLGEFDETPSRLIATYENAAIDGDFDIIPRALLGNKDFVINRLACQKGVSPKLIANVSDDIKNDFTFLSMVIMNHNPVGKDTFVPSSMGLISSSPEHSVIDDYWREALGEEIILNPSFYDMLNARIISARREDGENYTLVNREAELKAAREFIAKKNASSNAMGVTSAVSLTDDSSVLQGMVDASIETLGEDIQAKSMQ